MLIISIKQAEVDVKNALIYLEDKHLSSEHSNCVKVPFTDIGSIVVRSFSRPGAVRVPRRCLRRPGFRATGRHSGQGLGWAAVWLTLTETRLLSVSLVILRSHKASKNWFTIDLLYSPSVVLRQLKVLSLHPLIKGSHDGQWVVGVF